MGARVVWHAHHFTYKSGVDGMQDNRAIFFSDSCIAIRKYCTIYMLPHDSWGTNIIHQFCMLGSPDPPKF